MMISSVVIPNFMAFLDEIRLPGSVFGPVDFWAFLRLALICFESDIESSFYIRRTIVINIVLMAKL